MIASGRRRRLKLEIKVKQPRSLDKDSKTYTMQIVLRTANLTRSWVHQFEYRFSVDCGCSRELLSSTFLLEDVLRVTGKRRRSCLKENLSTMRR